MNGYRMRDKRIASRLFQSEVGAELGLSNETICRWEATGKELPKAYAEVFETLMTDIERIADIIKARACTKAARRQARINKILPPGVPQLI